MRLLKIRLLKQKRWLFTRWQMIDIVEKLINGFVWDTVLRAIRTPILIRSYIIGEIIEEELVK
jgi:hypothetical protein